MLLNIHLFPLFLFVVVASRVFQRQPGCTRYFYPSESMVSIGYRVYVWKYSRWYLCECRIILVVFSWIFHGMCELCRLIQPCSYLPRQNRELKDDCSKMVAGNMYCVENNGYRPTDGPTYTLPPSVPSPTALPPRTVKNCEMNENLIQPLID